MRRIIASVVIGLVLAIAIAYLPRPQLNAADAGRHPLNYFSYLQNCGAACVPLAAVLVVVTE